MNQTDSFRWFSNRTCEYFPCHRGADPEQFSCLFCYCPLYVLGDQCGGAFDYTEAGVKDCSRCLLPHTPEGFDHIISKFPQILKKMEQPSSPE